MAHRIVIVGNMITLPESPDHAGIVQALSNMRSTGEIEDFKIADCHRHHSGKENLLDTIDRFNPTLVVHGMTDSLSHMWPIEIKKIVPDAIQVMSMWDYRPEDTDYDGLWSAWASNGKALDLITLSNKNQLEWWQRDFGVRTMYWPHGCVVKDVEYDKKYEFDCVFVGGKVNSGRFSERINLLNDIESALNNRGIKLTHINRSGGDRDPERRKVWRDLGKIYYSSKTVLDISHFWDAEGYASGRYFYTSGLGGCAIAKRFPGCEELFPEGTKKYFDTPEEAADLVRKYVEDKKGRDKIREEGKEWANKYHNYEVRFRDLFKEIGK